MTGDLGRVDATGHLQLFGRKKNMIVTEEGKNIYPEDIETAFEGIPVKEFCVFAANYLWPRAPWSAKNSCWCFIRSRAKSLPRIWPRDLAERNRRLLNYKRVSGYLLWDHDFPRTASLKIKRGELAEQIRQGLGREAVVPL